MEHPVTIPHDLNENAINSIAENYLMRLATQRRQRSVCLTGFLRCFNGIPLNVLIVLYILSVHTSFW